MTPAPLLTCLLPLTPPQAAWKSTLISLKPLAPQIQLLYWGPEELDSTFTVAQRLADEPPKSWAQLVNSALPYARGQFLAMLAPQMEISPELAHWLQELNDPAGIPNYIYGNYFQKDPSGQQQLVEANPCPDDITEREDWGPLEIYRVQALRNLGGADDSLRFRPDYDLRLRLTDKQPAVYLPQPFCTIPALPPEAEAGTQTLFYPGRGKFGGFSYLFMDPAEEQEVEEIFYRRLKRRSAYLDAPPGGCFSTTSKSSPRVSVVMPVHNRADFLPLSIGSVQRGSFSDFEIIIIDNASEDNTLQVAQDLAREDHRIQVIALPDNVIAKALNVGLRAARGEYIAQLDSDDEYTPATLQEMVRHLDEHPEEALAISYYELINLQGETLTEFGVIKHLEYNRNNILRVDGAGAVRVWRKAAILEFGGFNEQDFGHYGEDYDLVLKVGESYEVGRVPQVLYRYRRHPGNSDVLRPHALKIHNKTLARQRALQRRQHLNSGRHV